MFLLKYMEKLLVLYYSVFFLWELLKNLVKSKNEQGAKDTRKSDERRAWRLSSRIDAADDVPCSFLLTGNF